MATEYDIFISHKKEQLSWAVRLQRTLKQFGYRVFVDHATGDNLVAGQNWEAQLQQHCNDVQYFILLWSDKIGQGSYVNKEVAWRIDAYRADPRKRILVLPLDEAPLSQPLQALFNPVQVFRGFIDLYRKVAPDNTPNVTAVRDAGADTLDYFAWNDSVRRFAELHFFDASTRIIEIPFVIVAMNHAQALELEQGQNLSVPQQVHAKVMHLAKQVFGTFDPARYGDRPENWKPLPALPNWADRTLSEIIAECEREKRQYVQQNQALLGNSQEYWMNRVFVSYTEPIKGNAAQRQAALNRLAPRPCLVFVDPISLMHREVKSAFDFVSQRAKKAFTIGMSPFVPLLHQDFNTYLQEEDQVIGDLGLQTFYEQFRTFFNDALQASVMGVDHGYELARWIQFATDNITRYMADHPSEGWSSNPNVRQGPTELPKLTGA
ncbi:MAG: toll/interleukin-1 receptor domain-containing protein [Anaerolineae bacterium]|nr:toll/interleukin-1 receptor domain-containing protein [Anaerolineae bacterium]